MALIFKTFKQRAPSNYPWENWKNSSATSILCNIVVLVNKSQNSKVWVFRSNQYDNKLFVVHTVQVPVWWEDTPCSARHSMTALLGSEAGVLITLRRTGHPLAPESPAWTCRNHLRGLWNIDRVKTVTWTSSNLGWKIRFTGRHIGTDKLCEKLRKYVILACFGKIEKY